MTKQRYSFFSGAIILAVCLSLFYLDYETKTFFDLFNSGNLIALGIYFLPVHVICFLLYNIFRKRNNKNSFALALCLGIPVGLILVIGTLAFYMSRFN